MSDKKVDHRRAARELRKFVDFYTSRMDGGVQPPPPNRRDARKFLDPVFFCESCGGAWVRGICRCGKRRS